MKLRFYDFEKRINSTKQPNGISYNTISCFLKEGCSIYNPVFTLYTDPRQSNYIYWEEIGRYYYIDDITINAQNLYTISCSIDVLASWKYDIVNTYAFVEYAQSVYNDGLIDSRLSNVDTVVITNSNSQIIDDEGDTYILSCASGSGIGGCYYLTRSQLNTIMGNLNVGSIGSSIIENMQKEFGGAYDAIFNCIYVPFNWVGQSIGAGSIKLGSYDTGVVGNNPIMLWNYSCNISIPWQFNDFRNRNPFTSIILYLPAVGNIELNPDDFIGSNSIVIKLSIDGITGIGKYLVADKYSYPCNFSTEISVNVNKTNTLGGLTTVAGNISNGNLSLVSNMSNIIHSGSRNIGIIGSMGGQGITKVSPNEWTNIYLYVLSHNTNVEPSNLASTIGRPDFSSHMLGDLSGYCKCNNASVDCNAPTELKNRINDFLNGGFIIE